MNRLKIAKELTGRILDVGGGGEGVIGRRYGRSVVAIDNRQEELEEAPAVCEKVVMDATALSFADASFDHVTFFFSLMYMAEETQQQAIAEAARVLKRGGSVCIWDTAIESAYPEPFLVDLAIDVGGETIQTTYGVVKKSAAQNAETVAALCSASGLTPSLQETTGSLFYLVFTK